MHADEIRARLRTGEDSRTDFKSARVEVADLEKHLCAMANSGGGELFVGVESDGRVAGIGSIQDSDALQTRIAQVLKDSIQPPLRSQQIVVEVDGMLVLVVRVPGFLVERPFRTRSGRYFVRDGPMSREARPDELKRILLSGPSRYFDEEPVVDATRGELDDLVIREFLERAYGVVPAGQTDRYLRALHALDVDGAPTVTGILLFGKDPQAFLLDAYVSTIRFRGNRVRREFLDAKETRGRLVDQLDASIDFLRLHTASPATVEGAVRRESGVPVGVWREAVTNALTHRDYQAASQTRIFVFDDRVEISNPGTLLNQLTIDGVRLGTMQRRNPHLASALARFARRENVGVGVPEMIAAVTERGLAEPEIRVADGEFRITIYTRPREP